MNFFTPGVVFECPHIAIQSDGFADPLGKRKPHDEWMIGTVGDHVVQMIALSPSQPVETGVELGPVPVILHEGMRYYALSQFSVERYKEEVIPYPHLGCPSGHVMPQSLKRMRHHLRLVMDEKPVKVNWHAIYFVRGELLNIWYDGYFGKPELTIAQIRDIAADYLPSDGTETEAEKIAGTIREWLAENQRKYGPNYPVRKLLPN